MAQNTQPALAKELETYRRLFPQLQADEGKFALIADNQLLGVYETYADALQEGYQKRELRPFLVKQIATVEVMANFTRDVISTCHTSAI